MTKHYLDFIKEYLTREYEKVPNEWLLVLDLLKDNIEMYEACKESIKQNGIYNASTGRKNPLLATCKDLEATILKQVQHLGISPYAASKIRVADQDDTDDFIESLTK